MLLADFDKPADIVGADGLARREVVLARDEPRPGFLPEGSGAEFVEEEIAAAIGPDTAPLRVDPEAAAAVPRLACHHATCPSP